MNLRYLSLSLLLLLALWQMLVWLGHWPSYLLPTPFDVARSFGQYYHTLLLAAIPTLIETVLGFILGVCLGSLFALCLALLPLSLIHI